MKTSIQYLVLCFCAFSLLTLNSCKEESGCTDPLSINYDAQAVEDDGSCERPNLSLNFNPMIGTEPLSFGSTVQVNGVDVRFDEIRFYVTDVTLTGIEGSESYALENTLLVKEDVTSYDMGEVRAGNLSQIAFNVGVSDALNNENSFNNLPVENPLSADNPDVQHWGWTAGYKFIKIEGRVDVDGNGEFDDMTEVLSIHSGFADNLTAVSLDIEKIVNDVDYRLNIDFDVTQFFSLAVDGITPYDITTQLFARPNDGAENGEAVMKNLATAFSVE